MGGRQKILPVEVAGEVESTNNSGQLRKTVNRCELAVVRNQETASNGCERGEGKAGQAGGVDKSQGTTRLGQVGRREGLESVGVETHGACDVGKRWHINFTDVSEGQVGGILKVGEADGQVTAVGRERDGAGDVGQLVHVDIGQVEVVVDVESGNCGQLNAIDVVQLRVGDEDVIGFLDTLSHVKALERR